MKRRLLHIAIGLMTIGIGAAKVGNSAFGSDFTVFAEDEDVCRRIGAAAIGRGPGPSAAQRYDAAYRRCMAAHWRMRQAGGGADYPVGNPHSFEYPDAFYGVPYATPGYGYDGFSD